MDTPQGESMAPPTTAPGARHRGALDGHQGLRNAKIGHALVSGGVVKEPLTRDRGARLDPLRAGQPR